MTSSCVAAALLNHTAVAPVARGKHARIPASMQLVLLEHSAVQTGAGFCRELIARALLRACPVACVCFAHAPAVYGAAHAVDHRYGTPATLSLARVERDLYAAVDKCTSAPLLLTQWRMRA